MTALKELREMATGNTGVAKELSMIADRIENEYIELPRDKNGEVIHVGDTVYDTRNQNGIDVFGFKRTSKYGIKLIGPSDDDFALAWDSTHKRPDSWEQIEASAKEHDRSCVDSLCVGNAADLVRRCKRLAGVDDE